MNINLYIGRLVLDETVADPHQRKAIKTAIESELKRQLINSGVGSIPQSHDIHQSVRHSSILIEKNSKPEVLGQQIGNVIYGGIGK